MPFQSTALCLGLIVTANVVPPIAAILCEKRFDRSIDGGLVWMDGRPIFGRSKTIRGLVLSLPMCALLAWAVNGAWIFGAAVGGLAMFGDLVSSFTKRRLGLPQSAAAPGLDQIPESLLPALASVGPLGLSWFDVLAVVVLFTAGDLAVAPIYRYWQSMRVG